MSRFRENAPLWVLFLTFGLYFATLTPRLIWQDGAGLWVGQEHLWSDWPLHIAMLRRFADCPPTEWLSQHPMIGGEPLRYPFAAAFLSGMLVRVGLPVSLAITIPTLVLFLILLLGMYRLWERLLGARWLPLVAMALFFCAAGPGALNWLSDVATQGREAVLCPPDEYARVKDYGWWAGNFVVGMLLPQRAFLPGMTLTVWLLYGLLGEPKRRSYLVLALGAGLLPIVHLHSLIALTFLGAGIVLTTLGRELRRWSEFLLWFLVPALVLAALCWLLWLRPTTAYPNFIGLMWGFEAKTPYDWPVMWWRLWGIFPLAALAGLLLPATRFPQKAGWGVSLGAALLFALANIVRFQPIAWDNSKVFLWAYFGLCGVVTLVLRELWSYDGRGKLVAVLLWVALTLTGVVELTALWRTDRHAMQILSHDDQALGEAVRVGSKPSDVFLTAMDISNGPMVWGARPIFLGFGGWMPNFGFDHREREAVLHQIYKGGPEAQTLLHRYGIRYVLIGPSERGGLAANEAWFTAHYDVAFEVADKKIYAVQTYR